MSVFKFKKFSIIQEKSAMKVGTDGVLLGCWVSCEKANNILDVGCGTGILAIYAKMQNAIKVVGVDNDPWAFKNAQTNEKESNVSGINWIEGVLEDVPQFKFDYVIANINKNVIKQDISNYYDYLKPGGNLFLSGFYLEDVHELNNLAYNLNLKILATNHQNDWAMLHFKK